MYIVCYESITRTKIAMQADSQVWRAVRPLTQRDESSGRERVGYRVVIIPLLHLSILTLNDVRCIITAVRWEASI